MSKRMMNEQQIRDMICGATLLGGGGGGSMQNGLDLLDGYKKTHKEPPTVTLITADEMKDGEYAAVTAGMGAPTAIKDIDFSPYAVNAFEALKKMAAKLDQPKNLKYSIAVEMGGFNTFVPMMISLVNGFAFVDADGAGRAVPALDTLLLHINGCDTSPLAMADGANNQVNFSTADPRNANLAEEIGRHICIAFGMLSGLSGWMVNKDEIAENLPNGSVTYAENIGRVIRECIAAGQNDQVFERLVAEGIVKGKVVCKGKVTKFETILEKGFDRGVVEVTAKDSKWVVDFQNENLLLSRLDGDKKIPYITVPDIICMYEVTTGTPLTNADVKEGLEVALGVLKVSDAWWKNPMMFEVWKPFLERVGYTGGVLPYRDL